jgi:Rrf2 family protein
MDIIRRDTDYAIRAVVHLAGLDGGRATCGEVARFCEIPKGFAYKLLRKLADAGLVEVRHGRSGGFRLRGRAGGATLLRIVESIQGAPQVSACVTDPAACRRSRTCGVRVEWRKLQDRMNSYLRRTTVTDILKTQDSSPGRKRKRS